MRTRLITLVPALFSWILTSGCTGRVDLGEDDQASSPDDGDGGGSGGSDGAGGANGGPMDWEVDSGGPGVAGSVNVGAGGAGSGGRPSSDPGADLLRECDSLNTGYEGDEFCLADPRPGPALFLHYGPSSYDDPDELEKYMVYPGEEVSDCVYRELDNEEVAYTRTYASHARPGMFRLRAGISTVPGGDTGPQACDIPEENGRLLYTNRSITEWATPAPEHQFVAAQIPAHARAGVMLHSINVTNIPLLREAWAVLETIPSEVVTALRGTVTLSAGLAMNIPPGGTELVTGGGADCEVPPDRDLLTLSADTAANTERVSVYLERAEGDRELIYETYDWHEPGELRFDSRSDNPAPDALTKVNGGHSGRLIMNPGDHVSWECQIRNLTDVTLRYGLRVYEDERCDVIGTYSTVDGAPFRCATL